MVEARDTMVEVNKIQVSGVQMERDSQRGTCTFEKMPVAMMSVDTTLAGLMSGVQAMVGTERFLLVLQTQGRKSVEGDWEVIAQSSDFREGFKAIANIAAVAGWGEWQLVSLDEEKKECRFRVRNSWEGRYQKALGVCWGSGMLAGKMAGYCSKLFGTNCWADQTALIARGDAFDEFVVRPSSLFLEAEIESLLASDEATRADVAVALKEIEKEINERKQADKDIARLATFPQLNPNPILEIDLSGRITFCNPATLEVLKHLGAKGGVEAFLPQDMAAILEEARENGKNRFKREVKIENTFFEELISFPEGLDVACIYAWDISERKQAQEAQRESETKYRLLFESNPQPLLVVDLESLAFLKVNRAAMDLYGYSLKEFRSMTIKEIRPPEDVGPLLKRVEELKKLAPGLSYSGEWRHVKKSGEIINVEIISHEIGFNGRRAFLALVKDITSSKKAEEAVRESELKYRTLFESSAEGFFLTADTILDCNEQACKLWKCDREDIVGHSPVEFSPEFQPDGRRSAEAAQEYINAAFGGSPQFFYWQHRRKDGVLIDTEISLKSVWVGGRQLLQATMRDITERKKADEHLNQNLREMTLLNTISHLVSSSISLELMVQATVNGIAEYLAPDLVIFFLKENGDLPLLAAGPQDSRYLIDPMPVHCVGNCLCGLAARDGRPIYVPDISADPRCTMVECKEAGLQSFAALPLKSGDQVIGILGLASAAPRDFAKQGQLLETLAAEISLALRNSLLLEEATKRAEELSQEVAERQRAEEALRRSEERFKDIAANALEWIWEVDTQGKYVYASPVVEKLLGYKPEEVLSKHFYDLFHPEDREEIKKKALTLFTAKLPFRGFLNRNLHKDGREVFLSTSGLPVLDETGELIGYRGVDTDITERKRAEEALRASEASYRQIVETANEGIWAFDHDSRTTFINEIMANWLGHEIEEMMGKPIKDFIFPEDLADYRRKAKERREGRNQVFERRFRRKDGSALWAIVSVTSIVDDQGEFQGSFAMIIDITDRKIAQERYGTIIQTALDGFLLVDAQGRILETNQAYCEMSGYTQEELAGMTLSEIEARLSPEEIAQELQRIIKTREAAFETRHRCKDGRIIDIEVNTRFLPLGEGGFIYSFLRNITKRKQADEQIRQSQLRLQAVFDGIPEPLVMVDRDMRLKLLNRAAISYYALDRPEELMDTICYQTIKGLPIPCNGCDLPAAVSKGKFLLTERQGTRDPNRLEEVFVYPLPDSSGQEGAAIIRISDITEARMMERHLMQSEKLASLGLLVASIAHEINNPNSFITFNIPILRSYLQELLPVVDDYARAHPEFAICRLPYEEFCQDVFKLLDNLEHGSNRINATVAALREFARERSKGEKTQFDLQTVIDRVVSICQGRIRKTAKTFTVDLPAWLPRMSSDPMALEQVLVNLLINAAQSLDKEESWITLKVSLVETKEELFIIEVNDNGCGMDAGTRQRIFDPFFTTKPPGTGTGLGLSIVHRLVEELGGRIEVESEPGQGTTFRLFFRNMG